MDNPLATENPSPWVRFKRALSLRYTQHVRELPQPHGFTLDSFVMSRVTNPIPVYYIWELLDSWRLISLLISLISLMIWFSLITLFYQYFSGFVLVDLSLRIGSVVSKLFGYRRGKPNLTLMRFYTDHFLYVYVCCTTDPSISISSYVRKLTFFRAPLY